MRIERISSVWDGVVYCFDQFLHGVIVLCAVVPVLYWGESGVIASGVLVLSIREWEQRRRKSEIGLYSESLQPFGLRHLDRFLDVAFGTAIALWVVSSWR